MPVELLEENYGPPGSRYYSPDSKELGITKSNSNEDEPLRIKKPQFVAEEKKEENSTDVNNKGLSIIQKMTYKLNLLSTRHHSRSLSASKSLSKSSTKSSDVTSSSEDREFSSSHSSSMSSSKGSSKSVSSENESG